MPGGSASHRPQAAAPSVIPARDPPHPPRAPLRAMLQCCDRSCRRSACASCTSWTNARPDMLGPPSRRRLLFGVLRTTRPCAARPCLRCGGAHMNAAAAKFFSTAVARHGAGAVSAGWPLGLGAWIFDAVTKKRTNRVVNPILCGPGLNTAAIGRGHDHCDCCCVSDTSLVSLLICRSRRS